MIRYEITNPKFADIPVRDEKWNTSFEKSPYTVAYLNDAHSGGVAYSPNKSTIAWKKYYQHEEAEVETILKRFGYKFTKHGESEKYVKKRTEIK